MKKSESDFKERRMLITVFSKDSKRGFAAGSNNLTPEKLAAGAVTAATGLVIAAIGGLLRLSRSEKPKKKKRNVSLRRHSTSFSGW